MTPLLTSIIIYILIIITIYSFKPKLCFDEEGKMKKFGLGNNKTPFTFLTISIVIGIFSLVISLIYTDYIQSNTIQTTINNSQELINQTVELLKKTNQ